MRHGHQQHLGPAVLGLLADAADVGLGGLGAHLAQKIVAANADHHQGRGVLLQQIGQAFQRLGAGIARNAGVDHVPAGAFGQQAGPGLIGLGTDPLGERVAQGQHGGLGRQGLGLGLAFAAGGQGDGGGAGQQKVAAVQKRWQAHAAGSSETNGP